MLESLLSPDVVAVIGASRTPGKVGYEVVFNLKDGGFPGTIIPVNKYAEEICGLKSYPDLKSYDGTIDMSVIAVPPGSVKSAVEESIAAGAKGIIVITAGFKEFNQEGAALEKEIATLCKSRDVRLLGPNCLGLINAHRKMNASFATHMPIPGGISVVSQSGALCAAILDWAASRKLGLAKLISLGNKADLSETDFLRALAADEETKVIVGYLESITSGDDFIRSAEIASSKKPVVIFKAGITKSGSKAASSHTGSLAGTDIAYGAAFKRSGVVRADTFQALSDYAMAFAMQPLPKGKRIAVITNAGGPGIMAVDTIELSGMEVSVLEGASATALKKKLPVTASVSNPIDVLGDADPDRYVAALEFAQDDDSVDGIIVILTPQAMTKPVETARAIAKAAKHEKPILVSFMGGMDVKSGRGELMLMNLPEYASPERAVYAMKAMYEYSTWLKRPSRILTRFIVNRRRVKRIINRHLKMKQYQMGEAAAKSILDAYGFNVPPGQIATSSDQAVEIGEQIGLPVAMKIVSPDITHKSDVGGVRLNINSREAIRDAFDLMLMRVNERLPKAFLEGVYVEKMCKPGREVILGMTRDPQFGPMLMFGLGGIFVEVMKDVTFNIAPITATEAMQMLESTKSFTLLKGVRGEESVNLNAIATGLQRISQLITDFPQIMEMDINPFIVGRLGEYSIAADARITLAAEK